MDTLYREDLEHISRRSFLKLAGASLLSLFLPPFERYDYRPIAAESSPSQGRVLSNSLNLYKQPSLKSEVVKTYWRDLVLPISEITIGEDDSSHNRVWYRLNNEGYAYSGNVQPITVRLNPVVYDIPARGRLAQVTVPFTDAVWNPRLPAGIAYRLYYSTTYWVTGIIEDDLGNAWYRIPDDRFDYIYYANAAHLHLFSFEELMPLSPEIPPDQKRLELKLEEQVVIAYEEDRPVFMSRVSTGARFKDGNYSTPSGTFMTNRKRPSRHMAAGDPTNPTSYDLPGIPWVCYLTEAGISFHGTYWHNDFGRPRSHGCINLASPAAMWIYRWTTPFVPYGEMIYKQDSGTIVNSIDPKQK